MQSMPPRWRFARMTPSEINQDPVQGEFFTAASDLPKRFVREAVQNSLDARRGSETVRVRFVFSGDRDALAFDKAEPYLAGLQNHVAAVVQAGAIPSDGAPQVLVGGGDEAKAASDALTCFIKPMTYLAVEDFGTTGLTGDIESNSERETDNHFWGFFRSIGISPKGADAGGSWGLGKWVFPDASVINAYLGITQREGDEQRWLLMGMAMLKTHTLGEAKFPPYGFFAKHSGREDHAWLPLPADDDDFVWVCARPFGWNALTASASPLSCPIPGAN